MLVNFVDLYDYVWKRLMAKNFLFIERNGGCECDREWKKEKGGGLWFDGATGYSSSSRLLSLE